MHFHQRRTSQSPLVVVRVNLAGKESMGRQSEKNDLKKTHANSYTLGTFSVDINYIVINWQINKPVIVQQKSAALCAL